MEVGYMTTGVKNKRIKIVGKNRFTALHCSKGKAKAEERSNSRLSKSHLSMSRLQ
jgi:hypothetical protein